MECFKVTSDYLLDTHIWLWSLIEPERLPVSFRKILTSENCSLYLSSVSIWEVVFLGEKGRIQLTPDPVRWVRDHLAQSPVREAPLNNEIAIRSRTLKTNIKDLADRFIMATAAVYGACLLTVDKEIQKCRDVNVLNH